MNTSAKGRRNEHRGRDFFLERGYAVIRSAGSFGIADLICFGHGHVLLVNGKTNMWTPPAERDELHDLVHEVRESGIQCDGVLMRFNDGDVTPKFKVTDSWGWLDVTKQMEEVHFGRFRKKGRKNNRRADGDDTQPKNSG